MNINEYIIYKLIYSILTLWIKIESVDKIYIFISDELFTLQTKVYYCVLDVTILIKINQISKTINKAHIFCFITCRMLQARLFCKYGPTLAPLRCKSSKSRHTSVPKTISIHESRIRSVPGDYQLIEGEKGLFHKEIPFGNWRAAS